MPDGRGGEQAVSGRQLLPTVLMVAILAAMLPFSAGTQPRPLVTFVELGSVNCIPCKMMQPIMQEIATEYAGQVKVVFYDVWTSEGDPYGRKYGIRAIPTQIFLDDAGKEYYRHEGYFPKDELVKVLKMKGVR